MTTVGNNQRTRMHPHKFLLWVGMGSIIMMFAGLTSAYIVRSNQANWLQFPLPGIFWYSTVVILCSSLTMHLSLKAFRVREMGRYRALITVTIILGILFGVLQFIGFLSLNNEGIRLTGQGSNPSASSRPLWATITGVITVFGFRGLTNLLSMAHRMPVPDATKTRRRNGPAWQLTNGTAQNARIIFQTTSFREVS